MGCDMVLHTGFSVTDDQSKKPLLRRQRSKFTKVRKIDVTQKISKELIIMISFWKDLAGIIFEEAMQKLLMDEWWKQFRCV